MDERDGFLSRWSRLKRGGQPARDPAAETPPPPEQKALPEGKELEDLIAALPRVEDLVPGQSLADFMQPWVPIALRNAALGRMWLLDPAISGYVDPALDYAYDYNSLGGAPGFGPMEASPEAASEVAEMFDRALGRADLAEKDRPSARPAEPHAEVETADSPRVVSSNPQTSGHSPAPGANPDAAPHNKSSDANELRPAARRHGGALPG